MTVQELIDKLRNLSEEDKNKIVYFIGQYEHHDFDDVMEEEGYIALF